MAQIFNANVSILGTLAMNSTQISSVAAGSASGHAVEYDQMNTAISSAVSGLLDYKGVFDASGTALTAPANAVGDFYLISVAGTAYGTTFAVGDHLVFNSAVGAATAPTSADFDKIDNTQAGSSLLGLTDTDLTGAVAGNLLMKTSSGNWEDASLGAEFTVVSTSGSGAVSINSIDADKINDTSSVNKFTSAAEISKLSGIEVGATADQLASEVPYTNTTSGLTATDVQAAIDEVEGRVDLNDAKVSADGLVTTHSDVTDAGSGAIITVAERALVASALQAADLGRYSALIGNGVLTTIAINHALGLTAANAVQISMFDASSGEQVFPDSYTFTDGNNLSAVFVTAPALNGIRINIQASE